MVGVAWRVWWIGAEPELLPPPKRLALASRLIVRPMHNAMAMLRKRFIKGIPICGLHARHVAQVSWQWLAA